MTPSIHRSPLTRHSLGELKSLVVAPAAFVLILACRSAAPSKTSEVVPLSVTGKATYEAVIEPSAETAEQVTQRLFIPAAPGPENQPPQYPAELLSLELPAQKIIVRITLDERGHVTAVTANPDASEADPKYRAAFEKAIDLAVDAWQFQPAMQRTFIDSSDDGSGKKPYKVLKAETSVPTYFEIRFTFEVDNGKGLVRQAQ